MRRLTSSEKPAPVENWFLSPECSMLAANFYGLPVVVLSTKIVHQATFPPMFTVFDREAAETPVTIFHQMCHFDAATAINRHVQQFPRVDPQCRGLADRYPELRAWLSFFAVRARP